MVKFNIDNQFQVSRNITWHFLIYCSSKARILLPVVAMWVILRHLCTHHHFTLDTVSKHPCFEGFYFIPSQPEELQMGSQHGRVTPLILPGAQVGGEGTLPCWTPHQPGVSKEKTPVKPGCRPHSVNLGTADAWWTLQVRYAPILSTSTKENSYILAVCYRTLHPNHAGLGGKPGE